MSGWIARLRPPCGVPERAEILVAGRPMVLAVRVHPRARRIGLALPADGSAPRLTLPSPRMLVRGLAFAQSRADWLAERMADRARQCRPFRPGVTVPVDGRPLLLVPSQGRSVVRAGDRLEVGGDPALFAARTERWLKAEARRLLGQETVQMASDHGLKVKAVRVGDPKSRWGSCTTQGRIAYSWRLLLAPPMVRAAVVAHELAHVRHRNHGPDFWAFAEQLLGASHAPARAWLRAHGHALHGWGMTAGSEG